jgi:hypothetical protein
VIPGPTRRRWLPGLVLAVPLAVGLAGELLPGGLELELRPRHGTTPLLALPIEPDERFTLHYIHSVDRAPIWEVHSVGPDACIYIEQEQCVMFGAGMGHWPGHGCLGARGKYQVIDDIHERVGEFVLRVGSPGVDHTLIWRGRRFNLTRLAAGEALAVSARPVSLRQRLWRRGPYGL